MKRTPLTGLGLLIALLGTAAQAACPSDPVRFVPNGAEVSDTRTGLVWARCSVGQSWSGAACTGSSTGMTQEQALALAQSRAGWRLPNVKELASLVDRGCKSPAIDGAAFPNTSTGWYWSSTPNATAGGSPWAVHFDNGTVAYFWGSGAESVRLVRISP